MCARGTYLVRVQHFKSLIIESSSEKKGGFKHKNKSQNTSKTKILYFKQSEHILRYLSRVLLNAIFESHHTRSTCKQHAPILV